jgi:hypothetical protein
MDRINYTKNMKENTWKTYRQYCFLWSKNERQIDIVIALNKNVEIVKSTCNDMSNLIEIK